MVIQGHRAIQFHLYPRNLYWVVCLWPWLALCNPSRVIQGHRAIQDHIYQLLITRLSFLRIRSPKVGPSGVQITKYKNPKSTIFLRFRFCTGYTKLEKKKNCILRRVAAKFRRPDFTVLNKISPKLRPHKKPQKIFHRVTSGLSCFIHVWLPYNSSPSNSQHSRSTLLSSTRHCRLQRWSRPSKRNSWFSSLPVVHERSSV